MKTKHTPGPWIVVGTHVERHDGDGIYSRLAACHDAMICEEHGGTALANARLIAAAPELLEVIKKAIEWADNVPHPYREFEFITKARAALAKAEGNQ